jgi:hypothetical protein
VWEFSHSPCGSLLKNFQAETELFPRKHLSSIRHMCCYFTRRVNPSSSDWSSGLLLKRAGQEELEDHTMAKDERDILEILRDELVFIEKGGYGRSVRTPWLPKAIFQDSLTCLNYGYPYRAHPCAECRLLDFVGPEDHSQTVPCHFIPLNDAGKTIDELELEGSEWQTINTVKKWLQGKIGQIEAERANTCWQNVD